MAEETTQINTRQQAEVRLGFDTKDGMDALLRAANVLCSSNLVPTTYRKFLVDKNSVQTENPNGLANCAVALNMASRMGADPLMIMQNMNIIEGRPAWSSTFIIASVNQCGRFSPIRFELSKPGPEIEVPYTYTEWEKQSDGKNKPVEKTGIIRVKPQECYAWAIEKATNQRIEGPVISMEMAVAEGWIQKRGSKWKTMQEMMLRYRAASFFGKLYAPELLMGLQSADEVHDYIDVEAEPLEPKVQQIKQFSSPVSEGWPIEMLEEFDEQMDLAYVEFKNAGMEDHWGIFEGKWRPRRQGPNPGETLIALKAEIQKFMPKAANDTAQA